MSESEKLPAAFISYTKADWDSFVRPFTAALLGKRIDAQAFEWEKKPGPLRFLKDAVKADYFVPVLSAASVVSQGVLAEINVVNDRIVNRPETVIPVILGGLPPERFPAPLLNLNYVRKKDYEAAAAEVARLIREEKHPEKPPLGSAPSLDVRLAGAPLSTFSLAEIRQLAAGDAEAQNALGILHYKGNGMPQNYPEAAQWFMRAAEQGNVRAQFNLGVMWSRFCHPDSQPENPDFNFAKAEEWYRRAAQRKHAGAQNNLGLMYAEGKVRGTLKRETRDKEAVEWYSRAAWQGNALAQGNLGVCYLKGKGVEINKFEAHIWLHLAKHAGVKGVDILWDLHGPLPDHERRESEEEAKRRGEKIRRMRAE